MSLTEPEHLALTEYFIDQNPVNVVIRRQSYIPDGKGGRKKDSVRTLPSQRVRKVGTARILGSENQVTSDGDIEVPQASIIAAYDADIQKGDEFTIGHSNFMVVKVDHDPPWRTQAGVVEVV